MSALRYALSAALLACGPAPESPQQMPYAMTGTVDGLDANETVILDLGEGKGTLEVGNGPFAFPRSLADGASYSLAVWPSAREACSIDAPTGIVLSADVVVLVHCSSTDATLSSLSLSAGALVPAFAPTQTTYAVGPVHASALFVPPETATKSTTVTATVAHAGATLTIAGKKATSGAASAPFALQAGNNPIDVAVTAPDGVTTAHYMVVVKGLPASEEIKPATTLASWKLGEAVAISSDGNTVAIGAPKDDNGGTTFVFTRSGDVWTKQATLKGTTANAEDSFGIALAMSSDGNTLLVGSQAEAAYVFSRSSSTWTQKARLIASNATAGSAFGTAVSISSDGTELVVGAQAEPSSATGIGGDQTSTSAPGAGAAYVFALINANWMQIAYVKASNTRANASFGTAVAISGDATTIAIAATGESSAAIGIDGDQSDTSESGAGAVYVFANAGTWTQEAYVKAAVARQGAFGSSIALSNDGSTLAVGSSLDSSTAIGINGDATTTGYPLSGATYVFSRANATWSQEAYIKASNRAPYSAFGGSVTLSADGNTLVVGSPMQMGGGLDLDGQGVDTQVNDGAAYLFSRSSTTWTQAHFIKAANPSSYASFGTSVALAPSGNALVVGAPGQQDIVAPGLGAAYVF